MRSLGLALISGVLAFSLACRGNAAPPPAAPAGPSVDPATAGTVTAMVKFEGAVPSNFTIAVTVPAVAGSTDSPAGADGAGAAFSPPHAREIARRRTVTANRTEGILPLWSG